MIAYTESTTLVPSTYTCDVCKTTYSYDKHFMEIQESFNYKWVAGYGSQLQDGTEYEINICQTCFLKHFGEHLREV